MLWLSLTGFPVSVQGVLASSQPADSTTGNLVGYLLGWGPLGIAVVALAWLFLRGWRLVSPAQETEAREAERVQSRADLLAERERVLAEKHETERQRDEAMAIARDQIAPLLASFVATTSALVPLLQEIIRESPARRRRGGTDP